MYFLALPLLLLVSSGTICGSPVRIESRGNVALSLMLSRSLSQRFHGSHSSIIWTWTDGPDIVKRDAYRARTMIKRVDLSAVVVHGVTDVEHQMEAEVVKAAQRKQVDHEVKMLTLAGMLRGVESNKVETDSNGVQKTYTYIGIARDGSSLATALSKHMTVEQLKEARESGVRQLLEDHKIKLDDAHNKNKWFAFVISKEPPYHAYPIMLRYANYVGND